MPKTKEPEEVPFKIPQPPKPSQEEMQKRQALQEQIDQLKKREQERKEIHYDNLSQEDYQRLEEFAQQNQLIELFYALKFKSEEKINSFIAGYIQRKKEDNNPLARSAIESKTAFPFLESLKQLIIEQQKNTKEDLTKRMSDLRKKGYNFFIEELQTMRIDNKLRLWKTSEDKKDISLVQSILSQIEIKIKEFEEDLQDKEEKAKEIVIPKTI